MKMKLPFLSKTNKTDNEVLLALDVGGSSNLKVWRI